MSGREKKVQKDLREINEDTRKNSSIRPLSTEKIMGYQSQKEDVYELVYRRAKDWLKNDQHILHPTEQNWIDAYSQVVIKQLDTNQRLDYIRSRGTAKVNEIRKAAEMKEGEIVQSPDMIEVTRQQKKDCQLIDHNIEQILGNRPQKHARVPEESMPLENSSAHPSKKLNPTSGYSLDARYQTHDILPSSIDEAVRLHSQANPYQSQTDQSPLSAFQSARDSFKEPLPIHPQGEEAASGLPAQDSRTQDLSTLGEKILETISKDNPVRGISLNAQECDIIISNFRLLKNEKSSKYSQGTLNRAITYLKGKKSSCRDDKKAQADGYKNHHDKQNKLAQADGYKNYYDRQNKLAQADGYDGYQDKLAQADGYKNHYDKQNKLAQADGYKNYHDKQNKLVQADGYKNCHDKRNKLAQADGYKNYYGKLNKLAQADGYKNCHDKLNKLAQADGYKNCHDKRNKLAQADGYKNYYDKLNKLAQADGYKNYYDKLKNQHVFETLEEHFKDQGQTDHLNRLNTLEAIFQSCNQINTTLEGYSTQTNEDPSRQLQLEHMQQQVNSFEEQIMHYFTRQDELATLLDYFVEQDYGNSSAFETNDN